jgi:fatty-acyl-CoA synthase
MQPHLGPTLSSLALRAFARFPDRPAFCSEAGRVTCAAVADTVGRFQAVLAARGIGRGHRVALLSANRWESWAAGLAAQALGAVTTWLHPLGALEAQLFQLEDAEASLLVVDATGFGARGGELTARAPGLAVLALGAAEYGADLLRLAEAAGSETARDLSNPEEIAALNYTGGTTGRPKGVLRSGGALGQMAVTILAEFELPRRPAYLAVAPISHVTGTNLVPSFLRGGTAHLLPQFEPERMLATIARERVNFALVVPTMVYRLLDDPALPRFDLSSLELLLYGASPMAP